MSKSKLISHPGAQLSSKAKLDLSQPEYIQQFNSSRLFHLKGSLKLDPVQKQQIKVQNMRQTHEGKKSTIIK